MFFKHMSKESSGVIVQTKVYILEPDFCHISVHSKKIITQGIGKIMWQM